MSESDKKLSRRSAKLPVLRWWWVAVVAVLSAVVTGAVMWLLVKYVSEKADAERAKAQLDAIRTALSIGVGAGGGFALWLAVRRQRSTEIQLSETSRIAEENKNHQERIAESGEFDAKERREVESYTKAVEQLGSEKAPVRLGGLYALERLAVTNFERRKVVVNVLCAYLRMPYAPPVDANSGHFITSPVAPFVGSLEDLKISEEMQVRVTAQRVLKNLLTAPVGSGEEDGFLDVDLEGASLIGFDLTGCRVGEAIFSYARFFSTPRFDDATFRGEVWFYETTFDCVTRIHRSTFLDRVIFTRCMVPGTMDCRDSTFRGGVYSLGCIFGSVAKFIDCRFYNELTFEEIELTKSHYEDFNMALDGWEDPDFDFTGAAFLAEPTLGAVELPNGWELSMKSEREGEFVRLRRSLPEEKAARSGEVSEQDD